MLQHFFEPDQLLKINGNSTVPSALDVYVPQFNMYNHSFSTFLANDYKDHLSLSKMAQVTLEDLSEPLLEGLINVNSNWPDFNGILAIGIIGTSLSGFCFLFSIWAFFKIRKLTTILMILEGTSKSKRAALPTFIYKKRQISTPPSATESILEELNLNHVLIIIIGILIICICVVILYKRKRSTHHTFLLMEITTGSSCTTIPLGKLPLCPSYWKFSLPPNIFR